MLHVRLARLDLRLPLELLLRRARSTPDPLAQHEGLVLAWELATRILAGSLWAACRELSVTSPELEQIAAKLDRPSFGHWVELARTCAALLREREEPAARLFERTLAGLCAPLPGEGGLRALARRLEALRSSRCACNPARSIPRCTVVNAESSPWSFGIELRCLERVPAYFCGPVTMPALSTRSR